MLKIGLTGGIGSGKSLVAAIFTRLGIPVFFADEAASEITRNDKNVLIALVKLFGIDITDHDGQLQRKKLREIIFRDAAAREKVNSLIHPLVRVKFNEWCTLQKDKPFILEEAAILFESGAFVGLDKVIMISSPETLRIKRVMQRDGVGERDVRSVISIQMDDAEKIKRSDFIIYNDEQQLLVPQVIDVFNALLQLSGAKAYDV